MEVTKREKRACACGKKMGVSTAHAPATIIHKGIPANSLAVNTLFGE